MAEPLHTTDDTPFSKHDIQAALEKFDPRKAPGKDALNSEALLQVFRNVPTFFTEVYNECLSRGQFPKLLEEIYNTTNSETGERTRCSAQIPPN